MKNDTIQSDIYTQMTTHILGQARHYSKHPGVGGALKMIMNGVFIETPQYKNAFYATSQNILGSQKYIYDESTLAIIEQTSSLATEEILGNLDKISFPFDRLWIVGQCPDNRKFYSGFLVNADSENHTFKFNYFYYYKTSDNHEDSFIGKSFVTVDNQGIHFDEDALLFELEGIQKSIHSKMEMDKTAGKAPLIMEDVIPDINNLLLHEVDSIQQNADLLARLFVVMGADRERRPQIDTKILEEEARLNRRRQRNNLPPKLLSDFIEIDLSLPNYESKKPTQNQLRALLGWTTVRRSKPITSKYGKVFTRKPHDRKIAAPEDRRGLDRGLIVGNPDMHLVTTAERPLFIPNGLKLGTSEHD